MSQLIETEVRCPVCGFIRRATVRESWTQEQDAKGRTPLICLMCANRMREGRATRKEVPSATEQ